MRTRHPTSPLPSLGPPPSSPIEDARRALARRRPEALLLLQLLIEDAGDDGPQLMRRLAGQLRLCADVPELAASAGCAAATIDPGLTRAAAALLAEAARGA
ncbi:MAG: hypothetical protein JWQ97_2797 [Phenylobacterium sp.]|nr:hypothetical protein [Phenylobacterium sp.]